MFSKEYLSQGGFPKKSQNKITKKKLERYNTGMKEYHVMFFVNVNTLGNPLKIICQIFNEYYLCQKYEKPHPPLPQHGAFPAS